MTARRATNVRRRTVLGVGVLLLLIVAQVGVRRRLGAVRADAGERDEALAEVISPGERIAAAILGGFRSILLNILWVRAQNLRERHQYLSLPVYYRAISELQGSSSSIYWIQAENMALDIPHSLVGEPEERWRWIVRGVTVLEEGRRRFPDDLMLLWRGGSLYERRFAAPYAEEDRARYRKEFGRDPIDIGIDYARAASGIEGHEVWVDLLYYALLSRKAEALFEGTDGQKGREDADLREAYRGILEMQRRLLKHVRAAHDLGDELSRQISWLEESLTTQERDLRAFEARQQPDEPEKQQELPVPEPVR